MARRSTFSIIPILLLHLMLWPTLSSQRRHRLVKRPSSHSGSEVSQHSESLDTSEGDSSEMLEPQGPICSGAFGHVDLPAACILARDQMVVRSRTATTPLQFGPPGSAGTDVETPVYLAVESCVVAISNSPDVNTPDEGLWQAMYIAAYVIIQECVIEQQVGGHIPGFNGNIGVTVFGRRPQVRTEVYVTTTELEDMIQAGIQHPERPEEGLLHDTATSAEPAAKKQKTCSAGESGYVRSVDGCCDGFSFVRQTFKDAAVQFGLQVKQVMIEVGICLLTESTAR